MLAEVLSYFMILICGFDSVSVVYVIKKGFSFVRILPTVLNDRYTFSTKEIST